MQCRLDLAFSVEYISKFLESYEEHLSAVKQVLRFVAGTCDIGLFYPRKKGDNTQIIKYTDSDLAGNLDSRKITSGVLFFLGRSPIC
jgi:hypothetical protein